MDRQRSTGRLTSAFAIGESEQILSDTIERVAEMHERMGKLEANAAMIPEVKVLLGSIASAQHIMAESSSIMAQTLKDFQKSAEKSEIRYEALVHLATGKDQMPISSHNRTVFSLFLIIVGLIGAGVMYVSEKTNTTIDASINEVKFGQRQIVEQVKKEIEKVAGEVNLNAQGRDAKALNKAEEIAEAAADRAVSIADETNIRSDKIANKAADKAVKELKGN